KANLEPNPAGSRYGVNEQPKQRNDVKLAPVSAMVKRSPVWPQGHRMHSIFFRLTLSLALASLGYCAGNICRAEQPIDFARDIQPILSENCFHCHGPDAANREADLRLDQQSAAESMLTPGDRDESE